MCTSRSSFSLTIDGQVAQLARDPVLRRTSRCASAAPPAWRASSRMSKQIAPSRRRRGQQRLDVGLVDPRQRVAGAGHERRRFAPTALHELGNALVDRFDLQAARDGDRHPFLQPARRPGPSDVVHTDRPKSHQPNAPPGQRNPMWISDEQQRERRCHRCAAAATAGTVPSGARTSRRRSGYSPALRNRTAATVPNVSPQNRPGCHGCDQASADVTRQPTRGERWPALREPTRFLRREGRRRRSCSAREQRINQFVLLEAHPHGRAVRTHLDARRTLVAARRTNHISLASSIFFPSVGLS